MTPVIAIRPTEAKRPRNVELLGGGDREDAARGCGVVGVCASGGINGFFPRPPPSASRSSWAQALVTMLVQLEVGVRPHRIAPDAIKTRPGRFFPSPCNPATIPKAVPFTDLKQRPCRSHPA